MLRKSQNLNKTLSFHLKLTLLIWDTMRIIIILILSLTALMPVTRPAQALYCGRIYSGLLQAEGRSIGFTQGFIGRAWAELKKLKDIVEEYQKWEMSNAGGKKAFIKYFTAKKPLPVIRDIDGKIRIIDNHHRFYALNLFYGKEINFKITFQMVRDYTIPKFSAKGIEAWTAQSMMRDLVEQGFIYAAKGRDPSYVWLKQLPINVLDMGDSPMRSLMSFVLTAIPVDYPGKNRIKGSDFNPHIQNQLGERVLKEGIEPFSKNTFGKENINRLTQEILENPRLVEFLVSNLKESLHPDIREAILESLTSQLETSVEMAAQ